MNVLASCNRGWRHGTDETIEITQLAVDTCYWPLYEVEDGEWRLSYKPKDKRPVEEWLRRQGRFRHLFRSAEGEREVLRIQALAAQNIRKFYGDEAVPDFAKEAEAKVAEMNQKQEAEAST